jgi:hypothetical protein
MGQNFMQHSLPEKACKEFINELKEKGKVRKAKNEV